MTVVKLEHSNLAQHQASIFKQLQAFRKEGQLCDVVVKSRDGREHRAHTALLCAASADLKNMLVGPFVEANQVQQGQPVEMAASDAVVLALLEYIYGQQPQVEVEDALELLRLADAYNFADLAAAIEAGLRASLDSAPVTTALKILQQTQGSHDLQDACEDKVAANFELCIEIAEFLELNASQLGRILRREDLNVSSEEVVVRGLFNWFNRSKDRDVQLGLLLQNIDFGSISSSNLARLQRLSASMGPVGHDLQREVGRALQIHKKRSAANTPDTFRPKRHRLQQWLPNLGASSHAQQKVLPFAYSLCCHDGAIYYSQPLFGFIIGTNVGRWNPEGTESQIPAGAEARVNGVNDLGSFCTMSLSPEGDIFVADCNNRKLVSFQNGSGNVVLEDVDIRSVSCSPSGAVYVLNQHGRAVEKLVGATLQPLIFSEHLSAQLQFQASYLFVTKDEAIYLSDFDNGRVLRIKPGEAEPVVVGEAPNKAKSRLNGLFVTEDEKIYVADYNQQMVWAFHPGDTTGTEVLTCPGGPMDVVVQGGSLYVSMDLADGVFQYSLPPELQLG